MHATLLLAALCAAIPETPSEQPAAFSLDITVVSAEGSERPLDQAAPSATVIGRAEIRASGAVFAAELLRRVAGVDLTRQGSPGRATVARLDGASAAQTLVLLDGIPLNSPTLGLADLTDLSVDDIEQVEVVRGPMSALYGSEAVGGVINIVTRTGMGRPTATAEFSTGAWSTYRGAVSARGALTGGLGYSVALSRLESDGRELDTPDGRLAHDAYESTTLSGGLVAALTAATRLRLNVRLTDAERDLPIEVFGAQVFDVNATQADHNTVVAVRFDTRVGDRVAPFARLGHTTASQDFADPRDPTETGEFAGDYNAETDATRTELTAGAVVDLGEADRLTLGFEVDRRHGRNRDTFGDPNFEDSRTTRALFVHNRIELQSLLDDGDRLVLEVGARIDDEDNFGTEFSPRVAALWTSAGGGLRLRGGAGRGFRAPSLNELVFPFYGNPDLKPEIGRTYEGAIGTRLADGRVDLEVRVFHSDFDDLITTDPASFTAVNLDRARVTGADLEARVQLPYGLWIRSSLTLQDAEDRTTGTDLIRRPARKGSLAIAYERPRHYRLALDLFAVGEQRDVTVAGFPEDLPGWTRVDLAGAYTLPMGDRQLELFGRVENLLDRGYAELTGFPAPGVNGQAGVRMRF